MCSKEQCHSTHTQYCLDWSLDSREFAAGKQEFHFMHMHFNAYECM